MKILRAIWLVIIEVLSIPLDIVMFIYLTCLNKRYGYPFRNTMFIWATNIKYQFHKRFLWVKTGQWC